MQADVFLDASYAIALSAPRDALHLYRSRPDQDWGLVDFASFVVMSARGIADALTADEHFEQAGFRALLRGG